MSEDSTQPPGDPPPDSATDAGDAAAAADRAGAAAAADRAGAAAAAVADRRAPVRGRGPASGGRFRRFAGLWGFLGFCILVLVLARETILPFVFALLIAYIFAPVVRRLSRSPEGARRMPRGVAIIICYLVLLAGIALFMVALLPRISADVARIGHEAPGLYKKLNDKWAPRFASWVEKRFPSAEAPAPPRPKPPVVDDVPLPPGTQFVVTPLPDGRMAVQLHGAGLEVTPRSGGGFSIAPAHRHPVRPSTEDRLRQLAKKGLLAMQTQLGDVFRFGQEVVIGVIRSVFTFFLVLMIAAFVLLDLEKIHGFVRGVLIPGRYRSDYDIIVAGIDRGLSGVLRGQLIICLINGVLTYIGVTVIGVEYGLILAVVAAVLSLIPIFGSILSTVPIVLAALVSGSHGLEIMRALFALAWIIGIHLLEANLLNPKIIGSSAKIHPVLVIFALLVGEHSYGLTGALLAVPVASIVQVIFMFFRSKAWRSETSGPHTVSGV